MTSVVLCLLTQAALMSPGKDETLIYGYILYIINIHYIYIMCGGGGGGCVYVCVCVCMCVYRERGEIDIMWLGLTLISTMSCDLLLFLL